MVEAHAKWMEPTRPAGYRQRVLQNYSEFMHAQQHHRQLKNMALQVWGLLAFCTCMLQRGLLRRAFPALGSALPSLGSGTWQEQQHSAAVSIQAV